MSFWKKFLIVKLCLKLALLPVLVGQIQSAHAQIATPAESAYWNMNRVVSGITQKAMESRGYVASDPRTYKTLSYMSGAAKFGLSSAAGAAAGAGAVTLAGVTAPAWASVALFIGVSAVASYGIGLALDGLVNWVFRSDNKLDTYGNPLDVSTSSVMSQGGAYCRVSFVSNPHNIQLSGGDCEALARQGYAQYIAVANPNGNASPNCSVTSNYVACGPIYANKLASGAPATCVAGTFYEAGQCKNYNFLPPSSVPSKTGIPIGTAVTDIPDTELGMAVNPQLVAAIANRLWQQASMQPGYDGIPYPQANPISTQEATQWQEANPQVWPSVREFVQPRTDVATNPDTVALPTNPTQVGTPPTSFTTSPNPSMINPNAQQEPLNLGQDPVTPAPTLERIPTAQEILDPILNLLPGYRSFTATSQSGQCPVPSINLYGTHVLNAHCVLIEQNKGVIQAAMTFAWATVALFIVLSA